MNNQHASKRPQACTTIYSFFPLSSILRKSSLDFGTAAGPPSACPGCLAFVATARGMKDADGAAAAPPVCTDGRGRNF